MLFSTLSKPLLLLISLAALATASPFNHRRPTLNGIGIPISNAKATDIIEGKYIVIYASNATDAAVQAHQASVLSSMRKRDESLVKRDGSVQAISGTLSVFSMMGWRGMTLKADAGMILEIAEANEVRFCSTNAEFKN